MKRNNQNRNKKNNDLVPILLIGGAVVLYFYLTRKKAIITVGPMSDPVWNAPENYTPQMGEDDRWLGVPPANDFVYDPSFDVVNDNSNAINLNIPTHGDTFDYYQQMRGEIISGAPRRRKRGFGTTC